MFRTKPTVADWIVIGAVLLCAALLFWRPFAVYGEDAVLTVTSGEGTQTYALTSDRDLILTGNGYTLTVEIRSGGARVRESDCPDHVCRESGRIDRPGETILCVPAGIRLTVTGGGGTNDVDFVAG